MAIKQYANTINSVEPKNFQMDGWNSHFSICCVGTAGTCCTSFNVFELCLSSLQLGKALSETEMELSDGNFSDTLNSGGGGACNRYKDESPVVHTEKGGEGSILLLCSPPSWGSVGAEARICVHRHKLKMEGKLEVEIPGMTVEEGQGCHRALRGEGQPDFSVMTAY